MAVKRTRILSGSLRDPIYRYITGAHITYNPYLSNEGKHFFDRFVDIGKKYNNKKVQENYEFSFKVVQERDYDIKNHCKVVFIDETTLEFDFTDKQWDDYMWYVKWKNITLYNHRCIVGEHDDDFED